MKFLMPSTRGSSTSRSHTPRPSTCAAAAAAPRSSLQSVLIGGGLHSTGRTSASRRRSAIGASHASPTTGSRAAVSAGQGAFRPQRSPNCVQSSGHGESQRRVLPHRHRPRHRQGAALRSCGAGSTTSAAASHARFEIPCDVAGGICVCHPSRVSRNLWRQASQPVVEGIEVSIVPRVR